MDKTISNVNKYPSFVIADDCNISFNAGTDLSVILQLSERLFEKCICVDEIE